MWEEFVDLISIINNLMLSVGNLRKVNHEILCCGWEILEIWKDEPNRIRSTRNKTCWRLEQKNLVIIWLVVILIQNENRRNTDRSSQHPFYHTPLSMEKNVHCKENVRNGEKPKSTRSKKMHICMQIKRIQSKVGRMKMARGTSLLTGSTTNAIIWKIEEWKIVAIFITFTCVKNLKADL